MGCETGHDPGASPKRSQELHLLTQAPQERTHSPEVVYLPCNQKTIHLNPIP